MTNNSIKKNYIYNICYQLLNIVYPIVLTPYISRVLDTDSIGCVSFIESVVSYFTLFALFGISTYGQRAISYCRDSKYERTVVFWNTKIFSAIFGLMVLFVYLVFSSFMDDRIYYYAFSLSLLSVIFDVSWLFQGLEEFGKIFARNILIKLFGLVFIIVLVKNDDDLLKYIIGLYLFNFLGNISLWFYLPQYIGGIKSIDIHPFAHFKEITSLFIPTIAIQIYTVLDKTMIGLITKSEFENGFYEQAVKIPRMLLTIVTALGTVMIPRIGYLFEKKSFERIYELINKSCRFAMLIGVPMCLGLFSIADVFVPWFYGPGYEKVIILIRILSFLLIAVGLNNSIGVQYLISTKKQNIFTFTVIVGAVVNFVLNMILIRHYYSIGAAVSSVIAESIIAVIQFIIVRKQISPLKVLFGCIKYIIGGLIMVAMVYLLKSIFPSTIIYTFLLIVTGIIVYFLSLLILKDKLFISLCRQLLDRLIVLKKGRTL